jgi:hypothetical protein
VAAHGLINVLQLDGLVFDKAKLNSVVAVFSASRLLLHHDARPGLNDSHRRDRSIGCEQLRHPNFSSDDSVNHHKTSVYRVLGA